MLSMGARTVNVIKAIRGGALKMMRFVPMPVVTRIRIPEGAVITPVPVVKRPIETVIISIIIISGADIYGNIVTARAPVVSTAGQKCT
jgi:hypothetical protein